MGTRSFLKQNKTLELENQKNKKIRGCQERSLPHSKTNLGLPLYPARPSPAQVPGRAAGPCSIVQCSAMQCNAGQGRAGQCTRGHRRVEVEEAIIKLAVWARSEDGRDETSVAPCQEGGRKPRPLPSRLRASPGKPLHHPATLPQAAHTLEWKEGGRRTPGDARGCHDNGGGV